LMDAGLQKPGKTIFGGNDADIDVGSTGALNATTLIALINPPFKSGQIGVSAIHCPGATSPGFDLSGCTSTLVDTSSADRPWISSDGSHVYIEYHDVNASLALHVQRSDDGGVTWKRVGNPTAGQGGATADSMGS